MSYYPLQGTGKPLRNKIGRAALLLILGSTIALFTVTALMCSTSSSRSSLDKVRINETQETAGAPRNDPSLTPESHENPPFKVGGLVVDQYGKPWVEMPVLIGGSDDPFMGANLPAKAKSLTVESADGSMLKGRMVITGSDGGFEAISASKARVHVVALQPSVQLSEPIAQSMEELIRNYPTFLQNSILYEASECVGGTLLKGGIWVTPPASDLRLVVRRRLSATVAVTVVERPGGRRLSSFRVGVGVSGGMYSQLLSHRDKLEIQLPLPEGITTTTALVQLISPKVNPQPKERVVICNGATANVELALEPSQQVNGVVRGPDGKPIGGALVFFGDQSRLRGDEPFKPFDDSRIVDGTRTAADGSFALAGRGPQITIWHPTFTPKTVSGNETPQIELSARSTLKGRVVNEAGRPVAGAGVSLDQGAEETTSAEGKFEFRKVPAGVRGLLIDRQRWIGAQVPPSEELDVEIGPGISTDVDLTDYPDPVGLRPILIGTGRVFSVVSWRNSEAQFHAEGVLPGDYLVMGSGGVLGKANVSGSNTKVEFGSGSLKVQAVRRVSVYIVPEGSHELIHVIARRQWTKRLQPGQVITFGPLPAARYEIWTDDGGLLMIVEVGAAEKKIELSR